MSEDIMDVKLTPTAIMAYLESAADLYEIEHKPVTVDGKYIKAVVVRNGEIVFLTGESVA